MLLVMDILSYLKYFVTVELLSWLLAQFQIIHNILERKNKHQVWLYICLLPPPSGARRGYTKSLLEVIDALWEKKLHVQHIFWGKQNSYPLLSIDDNRFLYVILVCLVPSNLVSVMKYDFYSKNVFGGKLT